MTDAPDPQPSAGDPAIEALSYDDAFAELQRTVAALEAGGQPLEATITQYERAVALQRQHDGLLLLGCQARIRNKPPHLSCPSPS